VKHRKTPLKDIRRAASLTQERAAKRIKVERAQLSRIENGRVSPTLRVLVGMARVYRVSLDQVEKALRGSRRASERAA